MKTTKFCLSLVAIAAFVCGFPQNVQANSANNANSSTIENVIDYVSTIYPIDRGGFAYPMALVGGHVVTELPMPLNVTLRIGGQSYTSLSDKDGNYSFMVYANARQLTVEAWSSTGESSNTLTHKIEELKTNEAQ